MHHMQKSTYDTSIINCNENQIFLKTFSIQEVYRQYICIKSAARLTLINFPMMQTINHFVYPLFILSLLKIDLIIFLCSKNRMKDENLFLPTRRARTILMLTPDIQIPPMLFSSLKLTT